MKGLFYLSSLFLFSISLAGATSTDEPAKLTPPKNVHFTTQVVKSIDPLASGGGPEKGTAVLGKRSHTVLDSLDLPYSTNNGSNWNGRYIYLIHNSPSDSASVIIFDPEDGSEVDYWKLPFLGYCMGITSVNDALYVSNWTDGTIRKVSSITHSLIATYSAPGGIYARGLTSDGEYLYIGAAGDADSIYKADTLINVVDSWYIGSFSNWVMDLAYAKRDSTIWLTDDLTNQIMKVDLTGPTAILLDAFTPPGEPASNVVEGISFDGSDLWFNTHYGTRIYRIDGEYSLSRVALFQDREPWTFRSNKDILYANGIPFKVFTSGNMGTADLSIYTKAIISSAQPNTFYQHIEANKSWWENWIRDGGVLEINGAVYPTESWEGLIMPGDFSCVCNVSVLKDTVDIVSIWHPMVNYPHYIQDNSLDNWHYSTHGYLTNLIDFYIIISDNLGRPTLAIKRLGAGGIIATMQTLEFAWAHGYCTILENVIKYWQFGVSKNVLFAFADNDQAWMRNALMTRYQEIGNVDYMDGRNYIPHLEDFMMYDVVLARSNYSFYDEVATGDTFAAYIDLGGNVVTTSCCWYGPPFGLAGMIMDPTYNPFYSPTGGNHKSQANLGWYDNSHPMMDGITSFSEYYRDYLEVNPGADTVAKYDDGEYLLGYKTHPSGGVVVGLNIFPQDTIVALWTGQMVRLIRNALHWSTSGINVTEKKDQADFRILEMSGSILKSDGWIRYYITSPGRIEFRIFDVLGRVVYSKNYWHATSGRKTLNFDVLELASGPYFFRISSGKGDITRKIIVVR